MSMVICDRCENPIDTDADAESWQEHYCIGGAWICETCREIIIESEQENG